MKTRILSLLAATLALTGCLSENPKDPTNPDAVYGSASALYVNAVASLYTHIGSSKESEGLQGTCYGIFDYNELTTDEAIIPIRGGDWYDGGFWQDLYNHNWKASDTYLYNVWKYLYKVISLCNESLNTLEAHQDLFTDTQLLSYKSEVRALRAMYCYYAMDMFGRIPIPTLEDTAQRNTSLKQYEREDAMRYIFGELLESYAFLNFESSVHEDKYYGRVTVPVACFLMAKIALNAEIYADNDWTDGVRPDGKSIMFTIGSKQLNAWETCKYFCEMVNFFDAFELESKYANNFLIYNEDSKENIFTIPMDKTFYKNEYHYIFRSLHYKHGSALGRTTENGTSATLTTLRAYGYGTDSVDTRMTQNLYTGKVQANYEDVLLDNGEPLVYQPLAIALNLTNSPYMRTAGARIHKYEIDPAAVDDGKLQANDIVLYRLADVLLMMAEAKVRNGEDGQAELNQIRARAGMPDIDCTLDNILSERLRELFYEGWRRQDLIRFGRFHKSYDLREANDDEADAHTTVFPIPQKSLELNTHLKQNKGY